MDTVEAVDNIDGDVTATVTFLPPRLSLPEDDDVAVIEKEETYDTLKETDLRRLVDDINSIHHLSMSPGDKLMSVIELLPKIAATLGQGRTYQRIFGFLKDSQRCPVACCIPDGLLTCTYSALRKQDRINFKVTSNQSRNYDLFIYTIYD